MTMIPQVTVGELCGEVLEKVGFIASNRTHGKALAS
jgi:hypothetical protein